MLKMLQVSACSIFLNLETTTNTVSFLPILNGTKLIFHVVIFQLFVIVLRVVIVPVRGID